MGIDDMQGNVSLERLKKMSGRVCSLCRVLLIAYTSIAAIVLAFLVYGVGLDASRSMQLLAILGQVFPLMLTWAIGAMLFIVFMHMFADISRGKSPFVKEQASRFRAIGCLLIVKLLVEIAVSMLPTIAARLNGVSVGVDVSIDLFSLLWVGVSFALSLVFKYGTELQELSDGTF